jgi:homoserine kinase type II
MAVLTAITADEMRALLAAHGLGPPEAIEGIPGGSVNSNFAVEVAGTRLFLRIYEEQDLVGAKRETSMVERLARAGVPTPAPLRRTDGGLVTVVRGKAAALFPWRDGEMRCQAGVTPEHARRVGEALGRIHVAGATEQAGAGRFRFEDLQARLDRIAASRDPRFVAVASSLRDALGDAHESRAQVLLPSGLTHGDLFRDNVLWDAQGRIAALLDFESASNGTHAYDLMVTVLAWCVGDDLDTELARAMREGYERVRSLQDSERHALWAEGCFAALRFTITRITDYALRTGADGPRVVKDWQRFKKRFEMLRALGVAGVREVLGA